MKTKLIKMEPQPPKNATYHKVYCDPYNGQDDKWTFWDRDGRMCLYDGNIPNTAHWKPPAPKPLKVVQICGVWYWLYEDSDTTKEDIKQNSKEEKSKYYGVDGQELLDVEPEEAFVKYVEGHNDIKYPVKIYEFEPMDIILDADDILEYILDGLDDEYGNPDSLEVTKPTDKMKKAAEELVKTIKEDYTAFLCENTGRFIEFGKSDFERLFKNE